MECKTNETMTINIYIFFLENFLYNELFFFFCEYFYIPIIIKTFCWNFLFFKTFVRRFQT